MSGLTAPNSPIPALMAPTLRALPARAMASTFSPAPPAAWVARPATARGSQGESRTMRVPAATSAALVQSTVRLPRCLMRAACSGVATARTSAKTVASQEAVAVVVSSAVPMSSRMSTVALFAAATGEAMSTSHHTGSSRRDTARAGLSLEASEREGELSVMVLRASRCRRVHVGVTGRWHLALGKRQGQDRVRGPDPAESWSYQGRVCSSW